MFSKLFIWVNLLGFSLLLLGRSDLLTNSVLALSIRKRLLLVALGLSSFRDGGSLLLSSRSRSDGGVNRLVESFKVTATNTSSLVLAELSLVLLGLVLELIHVLSDVSTEQVLAKSGGIELLGLGIVTSKTLSGVRDIKTTITSTLHGGEHTGTSGGTGKTNIKDSLEGVAGLVVTLLVSEDVEVLTINFALSGVEISHTQVGQVSASKEETNAVSGGDDLITNDLGVDDLGNNVLVGPM